MIPLADTYHPFLHYGIIALTTIRIYQYWFVCNLHNRTLELRQHNMQACTVTFTGQCNHSRELPFGWTRLMHE
jgi:hypothetical protein